MIKNRIGINVIAFVIMLAIIGTVSYGINVKAADTVTHITTQGQLAAVSGNNNYILDNNIALSGTWTPLNNFSGTLDGNGYVINGLIVNAANSENAGLFANLLDNAEIKNLGFNNANVTGGTDTGSGAGVISGSTSGTATIKNCYAVNSTANGNISGIANLAAVTNANEIINCYYNNGDITALNPAKDDNYVKWIGDSTTPTLKIYQKLTESNNQYVISSANDLTNMAALINEDVASFESAEYKLADNISSTDIVPIGTSDNPFKGKFYGEGFTINGTISNGGTNAGLFRFTNGSYIEKLGINIAVTGTDNVGGLIGNASGGTIDRCYSKGTITGNTNVGGLIGISNGTEINNSYTTGYLSGGLSNSKGGLVGNSTTTKFDRCYTTTSVFAGGTSGTCTNCFAIGPSSAMTGLTVKSAADMLKGSFAVQLNSGSTQTVYEQIVGSNPVLSGVGDGKNISSKCKVVLFTTDNGTVKLYSGSTEVSTGEYVMLNTTLTVKSTPNSGYELTSLLVNEVSQSLSSIYVTRDIEVKPSFTQFASFTIKVEKNDGGTITPSETDVLVKKGTSKTFTIVPDTGYKIESVKYTGSGMSVSDDQYTTPIVTKDETLTVKFVNKTAGVEDVSVTDDGVVVTVKSIEDVIDIIPDNDGNIIKVKMDKNTVIDKDTLEALQGEDITLILDMDTYSWKIYGKSISSSSLFSVNLGITTGTGSNSIESEYMTKMSKYTNKTELDIIYSGYFPFTAYLTIKAPGTNAGTYANLFYFNDSTKQFEIADSCKIADDGTATFRFTHASNYVVVTADKALSLQDLNLGAWVNDSSEPIFKMNTAQLTIAFILLLIVLAAGFSIITVVKKDS